MRLCVCPQLLLLTLGAGLTLADASAPVAAPGRLRVVSIREARQRLAAAPGSRPQCVLRGIVTQSRGPLPSLPGAFHFQDETSGIAVSDPEGDRLALGDRVEVEGRLRLVEAQEPEVEAARVTRLGSGPQVPPRPVTLAEALSPRYSGRLIRVSGRVVQMSVGQTRDTLLLGPSQPRLRAYVRRPVQQASVLPQVAPVGALVEVTGIARPWNLHEHQIRMRSSADLTLVEMPAPFSTAEIVGASLLLVAVVLAALAWILTLHRSVRRKTAEIRQLLDRAQENSRLKSEFLANVSHEIRTPMHGILGMTDLCLESDLTRELREQMEAVRYSAESLLRIVNDLLDLSKIEAGKMELDPVPFRLRETLADSLSCVEIRAAQKGLRLGCRIPPDLPDHWVGDHNRLRQVLVNLLGNAIKFTGQGSVELSAELESAQGEEGVLRFSVCDTGIGIPPDKHDYIFEAFAQADGSATRRYGGTGLGLAICSQLVRMMGGGIWVESQPDQGSTFHFRVKFRVAAPELVEAMRPATARGAEAAGDIAPLRILVAEDNAVNQHLARRLLEKRGHAVTLAANGVEVLRELERNAFDLLLLDLQMPELDGLATAAAIRARERNDGGGRLLIVALTAHAMRGDRERCLAAGMDDYLSKPLNAVELDALLGRVNAPAARTGT